VKYRGTEIKFWDQKVTVQGHGGITYAGTISVQAEAYSARRLVSN